MSNNYKLPMLLARVLIGLFVFIGSYLVIGNLLVRAQGSDEAMAAKYGITFPIAELGNCDSVTACRNYCEDPANIQACIDYAKSKGFYKEEDIKADEAVLARARTTLGCDSFSACKEFCHQPENYERCHTFAQSVGVAGGYREDPSKGKILEKAKAVLGCDSYETCRSFCENPANRDRCAQFAREAGLTGGYEYKGPGGCTTPETCRAFCENPANVEICRGFAQSQGGKFAGPGGCTDEASCRNYCEKNPQACGGGNIGGYDRQEMCLKTPSCQWEANTCQCGFYKEGSREEYCRQNPEVCKYDLDPAKECSKYGCTWAGSYCQCDEKSDTYQDRMKTECTQHPGCTYNEGYGCQCTIYPGGTGGTPPPGPTSPEGGIYPTPYSGSGTTDPASMCSKISGCSWTGSYCNCSSGGGTGTFTPAPAPAPGSSDPATMCGQTPGCSWTGSSCQCSSTETGGGGSSTPAPPPPSDETPPPPVYGLKVVRGFFQYLLNLLGSE